MKMLEKMVIKSKIFAEDVKNKLKEQEGSFFTENALSIAITVAIAGLILALMFTLFKDTLVPMLTEKIKSFFDFS